MNVSEQILFLKTYNTICNINAAHENGSCLHLKTRLVFRTAPSSGIVEICNEEGTWSIACSELIDEDEANVICRQLGYTSGITSYFARNVSLLNARQKFTGQLKCSGNEASLHNCVTSPTNDSVPLCNAQVYLQCGGKDVICCLNTCHVN